MFFEVEAAPSVEPDFVYPYAIPMDTGFCLEQDTANAASWSALRDGFGDAVERVVQTPQGVVRLTIVPPRSEPTPST